MLKVGIPKEIKPFERRVAITPEGVLQLTRQGITVFCEKNAGALSDFADAAYQKAGAEIVPDAKTLYQNAELIQKVKEPQPAEVGYLQARHILFSFLHLASQEQCQLVKDILRCRCMAIGYETVVVNGRNPILAPMSRIAGTLAVYDAALCRQNGLIKNGKISYPKNFFQDLEKIAVQYPHPPQAADLGYVIIWGAGVAGSAALEAAQRIAKQVTVIESNPERIKSLKQEMQKAVKSIKVILPEELNETLLAEADVFIGCVHRAGTRAQQVVSPAALAKASRQKPKLIADIAIDQGGNFPEAHATTYQDPLYVDSVGNLRFAVANIPALCGHAASEELTQTTLNYTLAMATHFEKALQDYPELQAAINIKNGNILTPGVKEAHQR